MKNLCLFFACLLMLCKETRCQVPSYVPTSSLLGWYPFSGNALNAAGGGRNGTVMGATLTTDRFGTANSAYHFNGSSDHIVVDTFFFNVGWSNYTISCWLNADTVSNPYNTPHSLIICNTIPHNGVALESNWGNSGKYGLFANSTPGVRTWDIFSNMNVNTSSVAHAWKHVTLVKQNDTGYSVYIDGMIDKHFHTTVHATSYFCKMVFGRVDSSVSNETYDGSLDDFGIWNRALTDCEVYQLYSGVVSTAAGVITGPSAVCRGTTITLSDTAASGAWSSSDPSVAAIGSSGIVTGVSTGTVTVVYTIPAGCFTTSSVTVNGPSSSITGSTSICTGTTTTLSYPVTGGVWSSSTALVGTVGSATGIVSGLAAGTTTITYVPPTGCPATKVVTVSAPPGLIVGSSVTCVGAASILTDGGSGTWSSSSLTVATVGSSSGVMTGAGTGTATISYTTLPGCYAILPVTVVAAPAPIAGSTHICTGLTTTLSDAVAGGSWSSGSPGIVAAGSTGIVTGGSVGVGVISYATAPGAACVATTYVTVDAFPLPIGGTTTLCPGDVTIFADATGGGTWSSSAPGIAAVGSSSGVVIASAPGTPTISYSLVPGCAASVAVTINPLPGTISGSPYVCLGTSPVLTDAGSGYWASSDVTKLYIDPISGIITGFATGAVIVTYALPTGCYTTMGVTVNPGPTSITGTTIVCQGASQTLFNGVSGGAWSSASPGIAAIDPTTGVYTGISAGTATVNYSTGSGCTVSTTVTVLAAPSAITGTLSVCPGGSTTLTSGSPGGRWSTTGGRVTIGSATGIVTGVSAGTAVVTYTTGCFTTATVTVNAAPVITGTLNVCPGGSTSLTTGSGGTWTSSNASIAAIGSSAGLTMTINGVASGTVTVVFTSSATGCNTSATVTVNPLPGAIIGPGNVCTGSSISLSSSPSGGTWTRSNTNINVSSSGLTIGVSAGTGTVTYTLPATGCYATKTITVYNTPPAIIGTLNVCVGGSITLNDATPGGAWGSSNTAVGTVSTSGMVSGLAPGTAVITYAMGTGCAATVIITVNPLPALFTVTGGGGICPGMPGLHIGLSGSATGTTYALYRSGTASGTSLPGTGSSIDFGPQGTGTYTVIAGGIGGCTNTMTGSMAVSLNPTPVISGPSAVCAGSSTTLTTGSPGSATWTSSNPAAATIGSATGVVHGVAIGSTIITCTLTTGCMTTTTVNVSSAPTAVTGAGSVCTGANTILSSSPAGGIWSSSTTTIAAIGSLTGVVTGTGTGAATITYSLGSGCNTTATINVLTSPAAITGTLTVCAGGSTLLTTTTAGGVWSSSSLAVAGVGSATGIVTGATSGVSTISYTAGACAATAVVTVNAVPPAIGGPASLCRGAMVTETNTMSGGLWSTSSSGISIGAATGDLRGTSAGTGNITYTVGGCSTSKAITVNTAPVISGATAICTGSTSTLTTGTTGAWSSSSATVATITAGGVLSGLSNGSATITFTPPTGCIATAAITVNSTPGPISGPANVCAGSTTTYTATVAGAWTSSTSPVATIGSATGILTALTAGIVTITCPPTGCSSSMTITVNALPAVITGGSTICVGTSTTLSSTTAGGIWSSGSPGIATAGSLTGLVSGGAAGTADISYTVSGCTVTKTVSVIAVPGSITGSNHVCLGGSTTLTAGAGSGTWSSSNPVVANVGSTGVVTTGATLGTATISYSLGPGCTVTIPITVDPLPLPISGGSNICVGSTTMVYDATPGGAWSSGSSLASINSTTGVVTGIAGGAALISYTGPNGCAATRAVTVIQLQPFSGIHPLCAWGDTMTVNNTDTTGIYTSTFVSVLNLGHGRGGVTTTVPGPATVIYTIPAGCSITESITVNPIPAGISGTLDICLGGTATLSNVVPGGMWSSGTPAVATIGATSGTAVAVAAGTTNIAYILPTGCKTDTLLRVSSPPVAGAISGGTNVCVGGTTMLGASVPGGAWGSGVPAIATVGSTGIVTGIATGVASVNYMVANLCGTAVAQTTVNVYPAVNAGTITGADTICAGNTTILSDTATGGAWTSTNVSIAAVGSAGEVLGLLAGADTIIYIVANPGCSTTAMHSVTVLPYTVCALGASPPAPLRGREGTLRVWPNPNDGTFNILVVSANDEEVTVVVSDVTGRIVGTFPGKTNKAATVSLKVAAGVYFISAKTNSGTFNGKVEVR